VGVFGRDRAKTKAETGSSGACSGGPNHGEAGLSSPATSRAVRWRRHRHAAAAASERASWLGGAPGWSRPYAARGLPSPPLARAFARAVSTSASWSCRWLRRAGAEADECSSLHGFLPHLLASSYISDLHHAFKTSSRFLHVKVRRL
jgi:hypothetical protein